ncbi:hypothetical protein CHUAL_003049 [Chamberlinius hualienensis]
METTYALLLGVLGVLAIYSIEGNSRQLLDNCYKRHNNRDKFKDGMFVCPWSPTQRVIGFSSTPGIYRIERHPVFSGLYDLLYFWECKTKTTVIVIDNNFGLSQKSVERLMKRIPATDCKIDIINVDDINITVNGCQLIGKYRYIVIVGGDNIIEHIFTTGNSCNEKSPSYTTWIIVSSAVPLWLNSEDYVNYVNPLKSQMTILIPQITKQMYEETKSFKKNAFKLHKFADKINIYDVFRSNATNKLERIKFAQWSPISGLRYSYDILNNYQKLRGRILRVTATKVYPYIILNETNYVVGGILYDPFNTLGQYLNAQHQLIPPNDFNFGIDINGSLTGMFGVMQRGEADFSITPSAIRDFRLKAARYGTKIANGYMQMVMPRPSSTVPPTFYIFAFDKCVWITIAGYLVLSVLILALTIIVTPHNATLLPAIRSSKRLVYWICSGQFLEIAFGNPSGWAVKWTFYVILTTAMTVFIYYTSIFTSFLTYRETKLPFETFGELADNKDYQIVLAEQSSMRTTLEQSKEEEFQKVWRRIVKGGRKSMMASFEDGYKQVLTGKNVFIGDGPSTQALAKGSCNTIFPKTTYMKESYYMTFRRDFPYIKIYSNRFLRQIETGIINRWQRMFKPEPGACDGNSDFVSLNLYHVYTLFIGLSIGIFTSLSVLIVEIIVHK